MTKRPIAGIVLAAGMSTRFGRLKQIIEFGKSNILSMVVDSTINSTLDKVVLVLGHEAEAVKNSLGEKLLNSKVLIIDNPNFKDGMSTSLQKGLSVICDDFPSIMILLGDQPLLNHNVINRILDHFNSTEKEICVPVYNGQRGLPVCFTKRFYDDILLLRGDIGAREIINKNPEAIDSIDIEDGNAFLDIDNEADLEKLKPMITLK
jgi:molybdenum cofactor cytidylyltransferase